MVVPGATTRGEERRPWHPERGRGQATPRVPRDRDVGAEPCARSGTGRSWSRSVLRSAPRPAEPAHPSRAGERLPDRAAPTIASCDARRIGHLFDRHPGLDWRVVLLGHRPHAGLAAGSTFMSHPLRGAPPDGAPAPLVGHLHHVWGLRIRAESGLLLGGQELEGLGDGEPVVVGWGRGGTLELQPDVAVGQVVVNVGLVVRMAATSPTTSATASTSTTRSTSSSRATRRRPAPSPSWRSRPKVTTCPSTTRRPRARAVPRRALHGPRTARPRARHHRPRRPDARQPRLQRTTGRRGGHRGDRRRDSGHRGRPQSGWQPT